MYAVSASDDGMSGPQWSRTHTLIANPDRWDSCCCDIFPTRCAIRHMTSPIGVCARAGGCEQKTTPRVDCVAMTLKTVVHVVLHCPALAAKVWPALLSFLAGLGLNRDATHEGTLLLSLQLPNDSNGVATSLAFLLTHTSW